MKKKWTITAWTIKGESAVLTLQKKDRKKVESLEINIKIGRNVERILE